jgi:hypothetical protein
MSARHATATAAARAGPAVDASIDPWLRMRLAPVPAHRPAVGGATVRDVLRAIANACPDPAMLEAELPPARCSIANGRCYGSGLRMAHPLIRSHGPKRGCSTAR